MSNNDTKKTKLKPWQLKLHEVIFEADTPAGKAFDVALLWAILLSVLAVMLESVSYIEIQHGTLLRTIEWVFTIFFTFEYVARIVSVGKPLKYVFSFYGIVDLLSIIPTYLSLFFTGTHSLLIIRTIRLIRVFRIFKLARFLGEERVLLNALKASRHKITVFIIAVLTIVTIMGTIMYIIEDSSSGFTSIPRSIYWAIVTLTTVGFGDIYPVTPLGQFLASMIMILGYAIIAVPTGIVSAELAMNKGADSITTTACPDCSKEGHDKDAEHCKFCGANLDGN
jgi:voltage-gated potassium channel